MSNTATVSGTVTIYAAPTAPTAAISIGAPVISPSSTTGAQLTYEEGGANIMVVAQGDGVVTVPFGTVSDADLFYLGTDQPVTVVLNGGAESHTLAAGGFMFCYMQSVTAATVQATTSNDATISLIVAGD